MQISRNAEAASSAPVLSSKAWPRIMGRHFAGRAVEDSVVTQAHFPFSLESAWKRLMFYEEVPGRPPFPLNLFMPCPVRTEGEKSGPGARVQCFYNGGYLVKRITAVEPLQLVEFDVIEQNLGIERCVIALSGSYRIRPSANGVTIILTTHYQAFLHPRPVWHLVERVVANQLHGHVLQGMRAIPLKNAADLLLQPEVSQISNRL